MINAIKSNIRNLGKLTFLRIWHDNTGVGDYASWFFGVAIVKDMQTGEKFQFINNQWLAVEKDDGQVVIGNAKTRIYFDFCRSIE